ncbi:MAG: hypothetical protein A3D96_00830 [Chlamydiae bacterium RIFCSPHIGHO2_12_FULL_44_59]|nr:MAG: hypothetical protein A2796_00405 [Chlamydiae bacterium RIFCSPHIGHO2_01_FULL_44_39]OGN60415.1 MAG: hypothetical protein A3D96_00830 [Chlamydiae bacterium RIFCSPHIGHO2_12_FULL_44_59]OGN66536.1 MAG: hypothetical protein A2978_05015 [Chlamydiae bacterium RIFCSPLOWO2_01_FULL_44_52]OGN69786.1 MAG: hypothetical protein A3I67_06770 [Chlamydiae bacterium RIFCSPLOWO2_02_FULL_45_22]OGN70326.1 MAG: hypothetical protein A3F79_00140 [Chlamydiae bacterium RIFCSPLOWO2_12_FULL_45_20]
MGLFLNTKIEGSGALAWIGDKGLAPFRYLFNGRTVRIEPRDGSPELEIHHVASFHKNGDWNRSNTKRDLRSSSTGEIQALVSVVLLIPGLVLSVFKLLAYFFTDVRERHSLAKEHFTPVNREIGSAANPITTIEALREALTAERNKPKHQPTNALIIHGDGNLAINEDPGILGLNPMKLILEGARIVHKPSAAVRLDDAMWRTGKWQVAAVRVVTSANVDASAVNDHGVSSTEEALAVTAPRRDWTSCKRYHMIFSIASPQQVAAAI